MEKAKKKNKGGNEVKKADDKITLRYSGEEKMKPCALCKRKFSTWRDMEGLEFVLESGGSPVCIDCAKEKAPEIYLI